MALWTLWQNTKILQQAIHQTDERVELSKRFFEEGLDPKLSDQQKLPFVWRWLVDAETNCLSLRHQIDKLHHQHEQDLKEVEHYLEHVWKLSNERLSQLQEENQILKKLLNKVGDQHNRVNGDLKRANSANNLCDSLKLKSAFKQNVQNSKGDSSKKDNNKGKTGHNPTTNHVSNQNHAAQIQALQETCHRLESLVNQGEERVKKLEQKRRELEIANETLVFKLSEALAQTDQLEHELLKLESDRLLPPTGHTQGAKNHRNNDNSPASGDITMDSSSSEAITQQSVEKSDSLQMLMTSRIAKSDLLLVRQCQDVQAENLRLKQELARRSELYEQLLVKYERRKIRHKERIIRIRDHVERETRQLHGLLKMAEQKKFVAEEELRMKNDYCAILEKSVDKNS